MPTVRIRIDLGPSGAGAADLLAQVYDAADEGVGFAAAAGFTEAGDGRYDWSHDFEAGFVGSVAFYRASDPSTVYAVAAVGGAAGEARSCMTRPIP